MTVGGEEQGGVDTSGFEERRREPKFSGHFCLVDFGLLRHSAFSVCLQYGSPLELRQAIKTIVYIQNIVLLSSFQKVIQSSYVDFGGP